MIKLWGKARIGQNVPVLTMPHLQDYTHICVFRHSALLNVSFIRGVPDHQGIKCKFRLRFVLRQGHIFNSVHGGVVEGHVQCACIALFNNRIKMPTGALKFKLRLSLFGWRLDRTLKTLTTQVPDSCWFRLYVDPFMITRWCWMAQTWSNMISRTFKCAHILWIERSKDYEHGSLQKKLRLHLIPLTFTCNKMSWHTL